MLSTMNHETPEQHDADVLILGAGMAGLAAARELIRAGLRVLVLEAEDRVGGRILTLHVGNEVVELGAEFVHGRPPELLALIEEAGLELVERNGATMRFQQGSLSSDNEDNGEAERGKDPISVIEELKGYAGDDLSFAEFIERKKLPEDSQAAAIGFVEGFNAADQRLISITALGVQQEAEDAIEGSRSFHIAGGYDQLPRFIAAKIEEAGGQVLLNTRVQRIDWREGNVIVTTGSAEDHQRFSARRVVVALPLGVLQRGVPEFRPTLPPHIRKAFGSEAPIRMGRALRFTLIFTHRFWMDIPAQPALRELSFLFTPETVPPVWWTPHPEVSNAITGWIGGPRTSALEGVNVEELAKEACDVLARAFQLDSNYVRSLLRDSHMHDWLSDPSFTGAYSYIAKGGMGAPQSLGETIDKTIYFAGEHTTTDGHWGTVHAALSSGLRAAGRIVNETRAADVIYREA
jgi:monoamine oxidase